MRVKLSRLAGAANYIALDAIIADIKRESKDDPIYVSDLLADWQMSEPLSAAIRDDPTPRHYLLVMRDEWGNVPNPGEIARRRYKKSLKMHGMPIPPRVLNTWKRNGTYDENRYYYTDHVIDEKGCIKVSAGDAEYFLKNFGVHGESKFPLTSHEEIGPEIAATDKKNLSGQKLNTWYWRYKEIEAKDYHNLPKRKMSTEPKRGNFAPIASNG